MENYKDTWRVIMTAKELAQKLLALPEWQQELDIFVWDSQNSITMTTDIEINYNKRDNCMDLEGGF
jgi:hypothetical protein